jgi:metal-dependent HD superfamily phosphatase/phosphodiesterase
MEGGLSRPPEAKRQSPRDNVRNIPKPLDPLKEPVMNAIVATLYRDLTCAAAALVISYIVGASFVQSTATAPATTAATVAAVQQA